MQKKKNKRKILVIESEEKKDNFKSKISLVPDIPRCLASSKLVKSSRDLIGRCRKDISAKTSIGGLTKTLSHLGEK